MILTLTAITVLCSCDPGADLEAYIENLTNQDLIIEFVRFEQELNKTLVIPANETRLYEAFSDTGSTFLEPSIIQFDSIIVYKPNDTGKNIYNIDEYWLLREPSKRFFEYKYEINNEDLE